MARPRTQVGTWGRVSLTPFRWDAGSGSWASVPESSRTRGHQSERWRARAKYRDLDGRLREIERWSDKKSAAEQSLLSALRDRLTPSDPSVGDLRPESTVSLTAQAWLREVDERDLAQGTRTLYHYAVDNYVTPIMGELALSEVRAPNVDRFLRTIGADHGPGSAKTARAVLSGILGLAVRHGAIAANPVRNAAKLSTKRPTTGKRGKSVAEQPRALTQDARDNLLGKMATSEVAQRYDVADLIEFMLRTGCRIGEAIALGWKNIDLDAGTVEVNATMIRVPGQGMQIQTRPKTAAGWRVLALSPAAVQMLRHRQENGLIGPEGTVFPSPGGKLRDPSNTADDLRRVLDPLGFDWVTSHTFRKTVATTLDEAGLSARQIADQLGHARPSLTQDVYMGRKVATKAAADLL
ncbi:MAG: tyrosine recombinase XerC [Actinomycetales bacterium]